MPDLLSLRDMFQATSSKLGSFFDPHLYPLSLGWRRGRGRRKRRKRRKVSLEFTTQRDTTIISCRFLGTRTSAGLGLPNASPEVHPTGLGTPPLSPTVGMVMGIPIRRTPGGQPSNPVDSHISCGTCGHPRASTTSTDIRGWAWQTSTLY